MGGCICLLFLFPLGEAKPNFLAVKLVLLIYIFDEGFQVGKRFISHDVLYP